MVSSAVRESSGLDVVVEFREGTTECRHGIPEEGLYDVSFIDARDLGEDSAFPGGEGSCVS